MKVDWSEQWQSVLLAIAAGVIVVGLIVWAFGPSGEDNQPQAGLKAAPMTDAINNSCTPLGKRGPLGIGMRGSLERGICWIDADGERSYEIEGVVVYAGTTDPCALDRFPLVEVPFSSKLPADATQFELPAPLRDAVGIQDLGLVLSARDGSGREVARDGLAYTAPEIGTCVSPPVDLGPY
jgi:hypothetical protein